MTTTLELRPNWQPADYDHLVAQDDRAALTGAAQGFSRRLAAVALADEGKVVAAALAGVSVQVRRGFLLYLVTDPAWRSRGLGTAILTKLENALDFQGVDQLQVGYTTDRPGAVPLEHVLAKSGWDPPTTAQILVTWSVDVSSDDMLNRYWNETPAGAIGHDFDPGDTVFDWRLELTDDDRATMTGYLEDYPAELAGLYPAYASTAVFPGSVGLRVDGRLAGWMILYRMGSRSVRFHMLYLHPDFRGRRLGLRLANEAACRAFAACQAICREEGDPIWTWRAQSAPDNQLIHAFFDATAPLLGSRYEQRTALKRLRPAGGFARRQGSASSG